MILLSLSIAYCFDGFWRKKGGGEKSQTIETTKKKKNHNNQKVKVSFFPNTLNGKNLTNQLHKFIGVLVAI